MAKERNGAIDFLRAAAATLIVLHHYQQGVNITFKHMNFYGGAINFAYIVELFFLISGLMMYRHVAELKETMTFKQFMGERIKRIIPLLSISVFLEAILRYIEESLKGQAGFSRNLLDIVVNALGLQSIGVFSVNSINYPTWYLSVLILCYVWLFLIIKVSKKVKCNSCYGYIFMMVLGIVINTYSWDTIFLNRELSRGYFAFFAGLLLAYYCEKVRKNVGELISLLFFCCFLALLIMRPNFVATGDFYFYTLLLWIPLLLLALRWKSVRDNNCKALILLGKASFSVYIWNEPLSCFRNIIASVFNIDLCTINAMIVFVLGNWLIGICSFLWIEKPISKLLRKKQYV